ncbi:rRNA maturation RNase YbeY [Snodgrassella communis]|jgi:probable rRNA maturation factor|uniref:Endoribonuclease YbeY n=1 Tax=Snodgrassella communis TaxID=2946699 RepID=A0A066TJ95_9NEIS|nr:rRNA maturation RNase YbeY [Snodgrassella communis]KDN12317.1 Metal-dependent hydrolase YbeY, involved in rRNA and/or ribosome maturation and assembly [Snodgrassella communis]KDN14945.1 Metal-dependent hydrolase YbeY, involved in rRNA and/or ribosome maturation and assembly [Snodgrassella communis]PIT08634.1 rRNA maturation RNase YbeY [Snodgrassella communis]PIT29404.1 rRNA maturation RNase YbeY [Snodgrassella communis]PIT29611.1 rRNA maturation RNase YbeY [Snodgrassella communis]
MKIAKKKPVLQHLNQIFSLDVENRSSVNHVPIVSQWRQWIWQTCKNSYKRANIAILLCDEEEACQFNYDFRHKNYATNVLSFALNEGENMYLPESNRLHGDLVFCTQVIEKEAIAQHKPLMAHYAHLTVHGTLHLMGYDHIDDDEAEMMEALEIRILHQLGYANPYAQDEY